MAKVKPGLTAEDYRALAEFRHALRQFLAFSEKAAVSAGFTPVQHQALLAIKGMSDIGHVSVGELAKWLGIRPNSCLELVERLKDLGLVSKRSDRADHRRMIVKLTARAERKLAALSVVHRDELRRRAGALKHLLAAIG